MQPRVLLNSHFSSKPSTSKSILCSAQHVFQILSASANGLNGIVGVRNALNGNAGLQNAPSSLQNTKGALDILPHTL
ncbi:hypothetical protein IV203_010818 [Nitzschia inconspicua]|uniref:Uncharacterized protein n=1 Tax=Nitzschia inconspicua TaxID=303405 RepID=A0A9K3KX54_9STRA|nr:hypothetical protein IV203_010818 [Nitzschia inconspicua]